MCYFLVHVLEGMIQEWINSVESNQFDVLIKCIEVYKEADVPGKKLSSLYNSIKRRQIPGKLIIFTKTCLGRMFSYITILTIAFA